MLLALSLALAADPAVPDGAQPLPSSKLLLPPVPGEYRPTNSLPVTAAVSPDQRWVVLLNNGFGTAPSGFAQSFAVLDRVTGHLSDVPDTRVAKNAAQSFFLGLAFSADGKRLYASVGSISDPEGKKASALGNGVAVYSFVDGVPKPERFIPVPLRTLPPDRQSAAIFSKVPAGSAAPYPAGLAVVPSAQGERLLVAANLSDEAILLDVGSGTVVQRFDVGGPRWVPSVYPHSVVASRDGKHAWVSLWNSSEVMELDLQKLTLRRRVPLLRPDDPRKAGSHPNAMTLSPDGKRLYVALANADAVAVVDTGSGKLRGTWSTRLPGQALGGATPDAVVTSPDGKRLYVANAGSDAVAVLDTKQGKALGFVPTEWYPTALALVGNDLYVATGKGHSTGPNSGGPLPGSKRPHPYIAAILPGSFARLSLDAALAELPALTEEVRQSNRMTQAPIGLPFAGPSPIKHVIYVIKENRTFDQVFGDLGLGDGAPSLTLYGEEITPNHHALARQFGVLDRFFVSGEISGNGHVWSTAAITSDYTERIWPIGYRSEERSYDFEGQVNGGFPIAMGIPDIDEPGTGYLWANADRNKVTHRNYGEFVSSRWCDDPPSANPGAMGTPLNGGAQCPKSWIKPGEPLPDGRPNPWTWPIPILADNTATMPELVGQFDPTYADFRMDYPDQLRADEFLREFNQWVATRSSTADPMPQLIVLRLSSDHTSGTAAGAPTPRAQLADNDLALGRVVEAVSNSVYWQDTAILVLEDDAQDGADHVDAHRSPALVISRFAPTNGPLVDSTAYTTVSMLRTLELLLGLPPMNNNDAWAPAIAPPFSGAGDHPAFAADWRNEKNGLLYQVNPSGAKGGTASAAMDFRHADQADAALLNRILWEDIKGDVPMPPPRHEWVPEGDEDDD